MKTLCNIVSAFLMLLFVTGTLSAQAGDSGNCNRATVKIYNDGNFGGTSSCITLDAKSSSKFYEGWPAKFYEGWPAKWSVTVQRGYQLTLLRRGKAIATISGRKKNLRTRFDAVKISRIQRRR